jgi:hypothetical protein
MAVVTFRTPVAKPIYRLGGAEVPGGPRIRILNDPATFEITQDAAGHVASGVGSGEPAVDIGNGSEGEPILAMQDGWAQRLTDSAGALGVRIDHGAGVWTEYWHLSGWNIPAAGAFVRQLQTIGWLGHSGLGSGAHCHLMLKVNKVAVDPEPYLYGAQLTVGDDMPWHEKIERYKYLRRVTVKADGFDTTYRSAPQLVDATVAGKLGQGAQVSLVGAVAGDTYAGSDRWEVFIADGQGLRTFHSARIASDLPWGPPADCSAEVATATQAANERIALIKRDAGDILGIVERIAKR